jgi:hypothetical protein
MYRGSFCGFETEPEVSEAWASPACCSGYEGPRFFLFCCSSVGVACNYCLKRTSCTYTTCYIHS